MSSFNLEVEFIKFANENNLKKVQACIDLEVDVNTTDDDGATAAHRAARGGHHEVIRLLAATGQVDWNTVNNFGWTPLHTALFGGDHEMAAIILQQDNLNLSVITPGGYTLAHLAVLTRGVRCVEILAKQENVNCWNIPNKLGDIPITVAVMFGNPDILKILLKCPRVDPNMKDGNDDSAVMKAIKEEEIGLARMLIKCPRVDLGGSLQRIAR